MSIVSCRFCSKELTQTFVDLGMSPLSNAYRKPEQRGTSESFYPLHAYVCTNCFLVQLDQFERPDIIFSDDYAYYSSYSSTWLEHCKQYTDTVIDKYGLNSSKQVIEIASNDGYLLQYFKENNIPVLGIEPAGNVADVAISKGIETKKEFFGLQCAQKLNVKADLLIANNVLAHVPNLNDFVAGMKKVLADSGVITIEFPHLLELMQNNQFDTIYHEHFSYFSLLTVCTIFEKHGLKIFDVDQLSTHGGSLRIHVCHDDDNSKEISSAVTNVLAQEKSAGLNSIEAYKTFTTKVETLKHTLLTKLVELKKEGKTILGYGAPAKGNTLLNYCGIRTDFISATVDQNPHKQGTFLPGTHIPVLSPEKIKELKPDYLFILPWNLKDEIVDQHSYIRQWGGKFITAVPDVEVTQ